MAALLCFLFPDALRLVPTSVVVSCAVFIEQAPLLPCRLAVRSRAQATANLT